MDIYFVRDCIHWLYRTSILHGCRCEYYPRRLGITIARRRQVSIPRPAVKRARFDWVTLELGDHMFTTIFFDENSPKYVFQSQNQNVFEI